MGDGDPTPNAFDLAMRRLVAVAVVSLVTAVIWHEVRLSKLEETLFTQVDGALLERRMTEWTEARYPPEWLKRSLEEVKDLVRANATRLTRLEGMK